MLVLILVALVAVLAASTYTYLSRRYSTWKRKGVPGPPAGVSLTVPKLLRGKESAGDLADRIYKEYRDEPIVGTYILTTPLLQIHDPEIIKQVLIREFVDFSGRGTVDDASLGPLTPNIFFLNGHKWRNLRVKLTPAFTSGKIKYMFENILIASKQMADYIDERIVAGDGKHCEDAHTLMIRLFVDTISSVSFGIESNVIKNVDSEIYRKALKSVQPTLGNAIRALLAMYHRDLMSLLRVSPADASTTTFFTSMVRETVGYREKHGVERADLLNLLMQLKNKGFVSADKDSGKEDKQAFDEAKSDMQRLSIDDVAAQVFIFFVAGFGTSSTTSSFTLYEMAKNPEILAKAQEEVDRVLAQHGGKINYEAVMSMSYLDKCVSETLRKYAPLPTITREAMVTRKVPLTEVTIEKGTRLVIPVRALHYDPVYWPDPERYDPERFSEEQKATRPSMAYLAFGEGPRKCIAARLGETQVKTALVTLLSRYSVTVNTKTEPNKVDINPKSFATTPDKGLNVTFVARSR